MTVPGTPGSAITYILDENIIKNFKKIVPRTYNKIIKYTFEFKHRILCE